MIFKYIKNNHNSFINSLLTPDNLHEFELRVFSVKHSHSLKPKCLKISDFVYKNVLIFTNMKSLYFTTNVGAHIFFQKLPPTFNYKRGILKKCFSKKSGIPKKWFGILCVHYSQLR